MAIPIITIDNQTASPVELVNLGLTVPANGSVTATGSPDNVFVSDVRNDPELVSLVDAGTLTLTVSGTVLNTEQSKAFLNPGDVLREVKVTETTASPTVTDDDAAGYIEGSRWLNTSTRQEWICVSPTTGAADWRLLSRPETANLITVGTAGDVDFTTIKAAVAEAVSQGASATNPFVVEVAPGTYTEDNPITVPAGVIVSSRDGVRENTVFVEPLTTTNYLFDMDAGTLAGLSLQGVTDPTRALVRIQNTGAPSTLRDVRVLNCSVGVLVQGGAAPLISDFSVNIDAAGVAVTDSAIKVTGSGTVVYMDNLSFVVGPTIPALYAGNPLETAVSVEAGADCHVLGINAAIYPKNGTQAAIRVDGGARCLIANGNFDNNNVAVQISAGGSNSEVQIAGGDFNGNTTDFEVLSSTGTVEGYYVGQGYNVSLVSGATFTAMVVDRTNHEVFLVGNTNIQYRPSDKRTQLPLFVHDRQSSGITEGGAVTDGGGLTVDVAAGTGWVQRENANDDVFDVSWGAATGLSLTANTTNYVSYNGNTEALEVSVSVPSTDEIGLAAVVTDGSGIRFLHEYRNSVLSPDRDLHNYLLQTRKLALQSGLAVSAGTTVTRFDVGSGAYYRALWLITFAGSSDAVFSYFYGTAAVNEVASQTDVDTANYDNGGTLTAMTSGYFRSDTVILTSDGRVSVIYGAAQYLLQTEAVNANRATIPSFMAESGTYLARLIVEQGVGIVEIIDERPFPDATQSSGGGGSGTSDHGALSGLGDDDHTQYLLVNGTRPMSGSLDMGGNSITNVDLVDGVDVSAHASRHNPGGVDALATAAPSGTAVVIGNVALEGAAASFSRSDHQHAVAAAPPVEITDATNAEGTASTFARSDHQHAHGNRGGGSLHALATTSVAGFMSAADKTKLDSLVTQTGATQFLSTILSTSLTTFQDAFPAVNLVVPADGTYLIQYEGNILGSSGNTVNEIGIAVDSGGGNVVVADSQRLIQGNGGADLSTYCHTFQTLTAGWTVTGVWRKNTGSGSSTVGNRRITIIRINSNVA